MLVSATIAVEKVGSLDLTNWLFAMLGEELLRGDVEGGDGYLFAF